MYFSYRVYFVKAIVLEDVCFFGNAKKKKKNSCIATINTAAITQWHAFLVFID